MQAVKFYQTISIQQCMSISPLSPPTRFDNFANTPLMESPCNKNRALPFAVVAWSSWKRWSSPLPPKTCHRRSSPAGQGRCRRPVGTAAHDSGLGIRHRPSRAAGPVLLPSPTGQAHHRRLTGTAGQGLRRRPTGTAAQVLVPRRVPRPAGTDAQLVWVLHARLVFDEMCTRYIVSWIMMRVMLRGPLSSESAYFHSRRPPSLSAGIELQVVGNNMASDRDYRPEKA
jgi:hypothetical protein